MAGYTEFSEALAALKKDPHFAALIKKHGPPALSRRKNPFQALCRSIIYQQVSGKAAASILAKFVTLFGKKRFPAPEEVRRMPLEKLRSAGLSAQKASYIKDLAEKFSDGTIKHRSLHRMESEKIVEHLTIVRGVGVWTVHMFLIFTLNRPDILPTGDLGIRKGFRVVYRMRSLPNHRAMERLARPWRAYASVASWYLWRAADEAKLMPQSRKRVSRPRAKR